MKDYAIIKKIVAIILIVTIYFSSYTIFYNVKAIAQVEYIQTANTGTYMLGLDTNGDIYSGQIHSSQNKISFVGDTKFNYVAMTETTNYALDRNGYFWVWGSNSNGQFGNGNKNSEITTVPENTITIRFKKISVGGHVNGNDSVYGIDMDGNIWRWGACTSNFDGETTLPIQITSDRVYNDIAVGGSHVLAIDSSGKLYARGENTNGQLGNNSTVQSIEFIAIMPSKTFSQIATGGIDRASSMAVDTSGNLYIWGRNHWDLDQMLTADVEENKILEPYFVKSGISKIYSTDNDFTYYAIDKNGDVWANNFSFGHGYHLYNHNMTLTDYKGKIGKIMEGANIKNLSCGSRNNLMLIDNNGITYSLSGGNTFYQETSKAGYCVVQFKDTMNEQNKIMSVRTGEDAVPPQNIASNCVQDTFEYKIEKYTNITEDKIIEPTKKSYSVTLKPNGGKINSGDVTSHTFGTDTILPTNVTKEGYTFGGWYENEELTGSAVNKILGSETGDKTYYAKWTPSNKTPYTIEQYMQKTTLDGYDFIGSDTYEGTTGETVTAGVTGIAGFSVDENNTNNKLSGVVTADGSLVLKVYYDRSTYSVTLNTDGGEITAGEELTRYTYGVGVTLPTPTREGYTFAGWYDNESLSGSAVTTIPNTATGDKTYYAKWEEGTGIVYKVEHYKQNLETNTYEKVETDDLTEKTGLSVTARPKTYEGYHENTTHEERVASGIVSADGSLVLKLYYDVNKYTVTFKNGDTVLSTQTVNHGASATAPKTPTKVGHTFTGWDKEFNNVTSDLTINAIWTVSSYKVTLNTNGGTIAEGENVTSYTYGVGATLPTPTKAGYTFAGWDTNEDLTGEAITAIGTEATGDKTYYAKWNQNQYTVIFKDGDTVLSTQTVVYGSVATAPETPTKAGYTFAGWDKDFSNVTSNLTVNAKWNQNQEEQPKQVGYKVEHYKQNKQTNTYDKVAEDELTGTIGQTVTAQAKTYEGYTENTSHVERVASGTISTDGSLVLKLYYDINQYKVIFKDGDKVVKEETVEHGRNATPPILTKPGYILSWDKGTNNITGEETFTAVWTKDPNYVDPNDGKEEKPSFLPQTGESYIVIGTMSVLMSVAVLLYLKYRKLNNM